MTVAGARDTFFSVLRCLFYFTFVGRTAEQQSNNAATQQYFFVSRELFFLLWLYPQSKSIL